MPSWFIKLFFMLTVRQWLNALSVEDKKLFVSFSLWLYLLNIVFTALMVCLLLYCKSVTCILVAMLLGEHLPINNLSCGYIPIYPL